MLRTITLLLFAALAFASNAYAGSPKLTLLFSGNTESEVRPCPS
ncbi:MAG: hypothetical protein Q7I92_09395 [Humidesulfovibrio sp.]|nr:hypothetical protein [Humidesulfovibrio sp.]